MIAIEDPDGLALSLLTTAILLSTWVAIGCLVQCVAGDQSRRGGVDDLIGVVMVAAGALALHRRLHVCLALWRHPWILPPAAAVVLLVVGAGGLIGSPYEACTLVPVGVAALVAPVRVAWACVAVAAVGFLTGSLLAQAPGELVQRGELAGVLGQVCAYPVTALGLIGLAALFRRFVANAPSILQEIRGEEELAMARRRYELPDAGVRQRALLSAGSPAAVPLTPAEIRVVEGLAAGLRPKQLAYEWGVALATVRTHIMHAKRKTGARTLRQLAALAVHPDWPEVTLDAR